MSQGYESAILGRMVDPSVTDISQEEYNAESLYLFDQQRLLELVREKVSLYVLDDYLRDLRFSPREYWLLLLREVSNYYSLNILKLHSADAFADIDLRVELGQLLRYLKGPLLDVIVKNRIDESIGYEEFLLKLRGSGMPYLFKWSMVYIYKEGFQDFIRTVVGEANQHYYSDKL